MMTAVSASRRTASPIWSCTTRTPSPSPRPPLSTTNCSAPGRSPGRCSAAGRPGRRPDLTVTAGWLSSLLAVSAADLGDHAAAVVWCARRRAPRHGTRGILELAGWAALTRSLIAWYQGDPVRSAEAARLGQAGRRRDGRVRQARRAGDAVRGDDRRHGRHGGRTTERGHGDRAARAVRAASRGIYSVPRADDPPYTGDVAAGDGAVRGGGRDDAADHRYRLRPAVHGRRVTSRPATPRTLLILALAAAGLGEVDEAAAAGAAAPGRRAHRVAHDGARGEARQVPGRAGRRSPRTRRTSAPRYAEAGQRRALARRPTQRRERPVSDDGLDRSRDRRADRQRRHRGPAAGRHARRSGAVRHQPGRARPHRRRRGTAGAPRR